MTILPAYPGGETQKSAIIADLEAHAAADRLVKGQYWQNGKGCAVGCTIRSGNHSEYETLFGIPQTLAKFEDAIFESLPNDEAMKWPIRFMSAVKVGADLSSVQWKFLVFTLEDALSHPQSTYVSRACKQVLEVVRAKSRCEEVSYETAEKAEIEAEDASNAECSSMPAQAALFAAKEVARITRAKGSAAVESVFAAAEAGASDRDEAQQFEIWIRYADKLIELMEAAPLAVHPDIIPQDSPQT